MKTNNRIEVAVSFFERAVYEKTGRPLFEFFVLNCMLKKDPEMLINKSRFALMEPKNAQTVSLYSQSVFLGLFDYYYYD